MLVPINDYLKNDYGKSLSEIYSRAYFDSVTVDGNIYGLSSKDITGYGISAVFNKSICEKYGIDPDDFNGDWRLRTGFSFLKVGGMDSGMSICALNYVAIYSGLDEF